MRRGDGQPKKAPDEVGARQCQECGALLTVTSTTMHQRKYCPRPRTCRQTAYQRRVDLRKLQRLRLLIAIHQERHP